VFLIEKIKIRICKGEFIMEGNELRPNKVGNIVRWAVVALYAVIIWFVGHNPGAVPGLVIFLGWTLMLLHAPKRYGWKNTLIFMAGAYIISTFMEAMSVATGFPFGPYDYASMGPNAIKIAGVPFMVGIFYIALGYLSWTVASLILNHADRRLDKKINIFLLPIVSAFVMCQFDLVQDPATSTFGAIWTWQEGGGVLGVPLVNFLGWFLTCYLVFQVFTLFLARDKNGVKNVPEFKTKSFWLQPILFYMLIGISYIPQYFAFMNDTTVVTDMAGQPWIVNTIFETAVTTMLFTMLFSSVLAIINVFKDKTGNLSERNI